MNRTASPSQILLLLSAVGLAAFGLFYIYSTGYVSSDFPVRPNWLRQCVFMAVGAGVAWTVARLDNRGAGWRLFVWVGYGVSVALLALVLVAGRRIGGARRWLAIGPLLLQPAEFAKVFTLLAGALTLADEAPHGRWKRLGLALLLFAVPMGLLVAEPSYGNAGSLAPVLAVLVGIRFLPRWLFQAGLALTAGALVYGYYLLYQARTAPPPPAEARAASEAPAAAQAVLRGYHLRRIRSFLEPYGGWNERQSLLAISGGGLWGKGYLEGTMKNLGFLPRTVAPTDFIFAVIAEEGGLLRGVLPILLLYFTLLSVLLHWGAHAERRLDLMLLSGGATLLAMHVFIGVGMTIRLIPVIGLPLPLLSYGGSFTVAVSTLLGVLYGCNRNTGAAASEEEGRPRTVQFGSLFRLRIFR